MEEFNKIQVGMTYEEVCAIVGGKGELTASASDSVLDLPDTVYDTIEEAQAAANEFNALIDAGLAGEYTYQIYSWDGVGTIGANAMVTFMDGAVDSKVQVGLS